MPGPNETQELSEEAWEYLELARRNTELEKELEKVKAQRDQLVEILHELVTRGL